MKRLFLCMLCAIACSTLFAQKPLKMELTFNGSFEPGMAYIYVSNDGLSQAAQVTDSVPFKKGKAKWSTKLDGVRLARISVVSADGKATAGRAISFYAVPGETLKLTTDGNQNTVYGGSAYYQQVNAALAAYAKLYDPLMAFGMNANKQLAEAPEAEREALQKKLSEEYSQLYAGALKGIDDYVAQHSSEEGTVSLLTRTQDPEKMADLLSADLKAGRFAGVISGIVTQAQERKAAYEARQKALAEARKKVYEGAVAPDFTLQDINGKELSLSSLRGKYVVLDWWGSWCGWCIKGMPQMKEYYAKYKEKLEILGIDCNDTPEKWKAAVEKHQLPWLHVYNPNGSSLASDYAIEGYPTKFVIDPEGKIAKIVVGESPEFYTYLDELFK